MLKITKGNVKPLFFELKEKYGSYKDLHEDDKKNIKAVLIPEQHFRCAYCMCRINMNNSTLEHYIPQSVDESLSLEYSNLFAVCDITRDHPRDMQTCDVHRGNDTLHIDPRKQNDIDTIRYSHSGVIRSDNPLFDNDISVTLNLNETGLRNKRVAALAGLSKRSVRRGDKQWSRQQIRRYLDKLEAPDNDTPYAGFMIYMLRNRLQRE